VSSPPVRGGPFPEYGRRGAGIYPSVRRGLR
jgi:hypothetical protein